MTMTTLYEGAYAKLNLTLDVLGKREDGYHDLQSVMQTISIRDDIEIDVGTGKHWMMKCDKPGIPTDETNLAWKAAKIYLKKKLNRKTTICQTPLRHRVYFLNLLPFQSQVLLQHLSYPFPGL